MNIKNKQTKNKTNESIAHISFSASYALVILVVALWVNEGLPESFQWAEIKANICGIMTGKWILSAASFLCWCHWTWRACMCQAGGVELVWWACSTHGHDANLDKQAHENNLWLRAERVDVMERVVWKVETNQFLYMKMKICTPGLSVHSFREV